MTGSRISLPHSPIRRPCSPPDVAAMPLIVKLQNPRHRKAESAAATVAEEASAAVGDGQSKVEPQGRKDIVTDTRTLAAEEKRESHVDERSVLTAMTDRPEDFKPEEMDALEALQKLSLGGSFSAAERPEAPGSSTIAATSETPQQSSSSLADPPLLDVIVAPAVMAHRFVRGRDVSLIVERPERIRAVLLGVAAVYGRIAAGELSETAAKPGFQEIGPAKGPSAVAASDEDDLASQLAGMSMAAPKRIDRPQDEGESASQEPPHLPPRPMQILHSAYSVPIDRHAALNAVHATEDDTLEAILPEIEARRRSKAARHESTALESSSRPGQASQPQLHLNEYISRLCSYAPHSSPPPPPMPARVSRRGGPVTPIFEGRTRSSLRHTSTQGQPETLAVMAAAAQSSLPSQETGSTALQLVAADVQAGPEDTSKPVQAHAADVPVIQNDQQPTPTQVSTQPLLPVPTAQQPSGQIEPHSSASSSSDDDEEHMHPSEVPSQFPQGDLYLRGTAFEDPANLTGYGTREAIEHAVGASIAAVDRVVLSARCSSRGSRSTTAGDPADSDGLAASTDGLHQQHQSITPLLTDKTARQNPARCAFVLTRPPGHHCSSSQPSGFCWVNNVAIAAQHAFQQHGVDRVCIFDIDLHHGNGTQKIVWHINEEARRSDAERDAKLAALKRLHQSTVSPSKQRASKGAGKGTAAGNPPPEAASKIPPRALRVYYSSLHDIESFPCEDSDPELVRDASVVLNGAHGQWITNVHLDSYDSPQHFSDLYDQRYAPVLLGGARRFLKETGADPSRTLFLISCGFDACSYELPGMQRHNKHVPPGFYGRVAEDIVCLADELADGKVVSLLEGGYGDRALCSGTVAHLLGLMRQSRTPEAQSTQESVVADSARLRMQNSRTSTPARPSAASTAAALDPFASSWFSLESLKTLEKLLATATAGAIAKSSVSSSTRYGPQVSTTEGSASTTARVVRGGAGSSSATAQPLWVKETATAFATLDELIEPLMRGFWPTMKAAQRRR
ncbi:unnamed protein product [Parajaminaea phylloscopi]